MKLERRIERRIEVSPAEVYDALATRYDLPTGDGAEASFDIEASYSGCLVLVVKDASEQEL